MPACVRYSRNFILALGVAAANLAPGPAQAIDLLESYQAALTQDADYRAAQAQAESNREVVTMARAQLYPNISATYSRFQNDLNTRNLFQDYNSSYPSSSMALTLRQPVYRPMQLAGYQQALAKLDGVEATLSKAQQDAVVRVATAYFGALLAEEALRFVLAQQRAIATQLTAATKALAAGSGTRTDIDDAQARLDLNRAEEINARQEIDQTRHELAILINQPVSSVTPLNAARLELLQMDPDTLDKWMERAESGSPDLQTLRSEAEANRLEVERVKAGHKPTVDLMLQYSRNDSDNVTNPNVSYTNSQVGIQVTLPIYAGGYVNAQVRSATASLTETQERLESTRRKLTTEVRKHFNAVTKGIAKVRALEQAERSADQAVMSNEKGLQAGTRSRVDILNAEQQRSQTRMDLAKERINYVLARLQLLALSGDLGRDEIVTANRWLASGS